MKANTLKQLLALGTILFCQYAFGQLPSIDSTKLIPENPVAGDEIKVICYATFSSGSCDLYNHLLFIEGNQLSLNMNYTQGAATYICHAVDTVSLGNLNPGDYQLNINLTINPMDAIKDFVNLDFSVGRPLGIAGDRNTFNVSIHPNPFQQKFRIEANTQIETIELYSISGQKINVELTSGLAKTIDLSDLQDGIYLLTVTDQKGNRHSKRIVKSSLNK